MISEIKRSKENSTPYIFKNAIVDKMGWDKFIEYLDYCYKVGKTHYRVFNNYYFVLEVFEDDISKLDGLDLEFFNKINNAHPNKIQRRPVLLVNLIGNTGSLGMHKDPVDQFHLACVGVSNWSIELLDGSITSITAEPGDIVFIPNGLRHSVTSDFPRAGITFSAY